MPLASPTFFEIQANPISLLYSRLCWNLRKQQLWFVPLNLVIFSFAPNMLFGAPFVSFRARFFLVLLLSLFLDRKADILQTAWEKTII